MKKEKLKVIIIAILILILIVLSILLIIKNINNKLPEEITLKDSMLSEEEIYKEVLTEVLYGEEKYVVHDESGKRINTSDKMKETASIDGINGLEVEGINISSQNDTTVISGNVKNVGNSTLGDCIVTISLEDDKKIEILGIGVYIDAVAPGETTNFKTAATIDLANAYSYSVYK